MLTIDRLKDFGADTDEGLARCCENEALYLRLVNILPADENFDVLEKALAEGDLDRAFEASHALKGILGNLSLKPMYELCSRITELLRSRAEADYSTLVTELLAQRDVLRTMCAE